MITCRWPGLLRTVATGFRRKRFMGLVAACYLTLRVNGLPHAHQSLCQMQAGKVPRRLSQELAQRGWPALVLQRMQQSTSAGPYPSRESEKSAAACRQEGGVGHWRLSSVCVEAIAQALSVRPPDRQYCGSPKALLSWSINSRTRSGKCRRCGKTA